MKEKGEKIEFGLAHGVFDILVQAKKNERHEDYTVFLTGDLCQMAAQEKFLKSHGVDIQFNNVYPCVKECDKEETFQLIWKYKCNGWWHYSGEYKKLGICTQDEFIETLSRWHDGHK